jgi:hypothetical protein
MYSMGLGVSHRVTLHDCHVHDDGTGVHDVDACASDNAVDKGVATGDGQTCRAQFRVVIKLRSET